MIICCGIGLFLPHLRLCASNGAFKVHFSLKVVLAKWRLKFSSSGKLFYIFVCFTFKTIFFSPLCLFFANSNLSENYRGKLSPFSFFMYLSFLSLFPVSSTSPSSHSIQLFIFVTFKKISVFFVVCSLLPFFVLNSLCL
jgi:hypothetical protein